MKDRDLKFMWYIWSRKVQDVKENIWNVDLAYQHHENEQTFLHAALFDYNPNAEIVKILLNNGAKANINIQDKWLMTPLHYAAQNADPAILKMVLAKCKDAILDIKDKDDKTPFDYVLAGGNKEKLEILLDSFHKRGITADSTWLRDKLTHPDRQGNTPLYRAARRGYDGVVKFLVENKDKYGILVNTSDYSILNYYTHNPDMRRFLFENGALPSPRKPQTQNMLNIIQDKQSVHNSEALKQIRFYITELKNTFKDSSVKIEEESSDLKLGIKNLFSGDRELFINLASLPLSEKESLFAPIFEILEDKKSEARGTEQEVYDKKLQKYRELVNGPNEELVKEIRTIAAFTIEGWLKKDQGKYVQQKSRDEFQYQYADDSKITLPQILGLIKLLIDQEPTNLLEKKELVVNFFEQNKELVKENLQELHKTLPDVTIEQLTDKTSCHKLLETLGEPTTENLYKLVSGEDISVSLKEQKLFKLAKGIFASAIAYGEDSPACFVGTVYQVASTVGEIKPAMEDKRLNFISPDLTKNVIDENNVNAVVEGIAERIIELAQETPATAKLLQNALLMVEEPSLESIPIDKPDSMTLAQQQLLCIITKAASENIPTLLPNYRSPPILQSKELNLLISKISENVQLQRWALAYQEPEQKLESGTKNRKIGKVFRCFNFRSIVGAPAGEPTTGFVQRFRRGATNSRGSQR